MDRMMMPKKADLPKKLTRVIYWYGVQIAPVVKVIVRIT
jgi:hypothetical protein